MSRASTRPRTSSSRSSTSQNPERYTSRGAASRRGAALRSAGTGKTLLARRSGGRRRPPYFSLSASEFVRRSWVWARRGCATCSIRPRGGAAIVSSTSSNDRTSRSDVGDQRRSREPRSNAQPILTEGRIRAGNKRHRGCATNRPEVLDRRCWAGASTAGSPSSPRQNGRAEILRIHTRSVPLAAGWTWAGRGPRRQAHRCDLALCVNRRRCSPRGGTTRRRAGGLRRRDREIILGAERQIVMSDADRGRSAFHESARAGRHASPARTRAQGSRSSRAGSTGVDALDAGERSLQLSATSDRQDQGRARRARRREVVYDRDHDRRRVGHPNLTQIARGNGRRWA